ncbi:subclass B1 metallo-beta-lactamase [Alteromonas gilva]|uniref:beta-lactamase n=1 Tax=Alteromonas gilva TaxID=2987522 RepID=A0ABT5L629_9ALTE|nr:subclass B1 metallo-beta-lactamase [Alteromonas gilva]MDC8832518.1 subclass B1 metallo-beta-lactamase [Alteromonas gilva]
MRAVAFYLFSLCCLSLPATLVYSADFTVTQLKDKVYLHQSGRYVEGFGMVTGNGLLVLTDNQQAVLIDTPWDAADIEALFNWLEARDITLQGVVVTHSHDDAGGHLAYFHERGIPSWAYSLTNKLLAEQGETPAQHTFNNSEWVVASSIEAFYPGPGHTLDNTVVWLAAHNVLFGGCFVREAATESLGYTAEGDVSVWPDSVAKVQERYPSAQWVIPGHGEVGGKA